MATKNSLDATMPVLRTSRINVCVHFWKPKQRKTRCCTRWTTWQFRNADNLDMLSELALAATLAACGQSGRIFFTLYTLITHALTNISALSHPVGQSARKILYGSCPVVHLSGARVGRSEPIRRYSPNMQRVKLCVCEFHGSMKSLRNHPTIWRKTHTQNSVT